MKPKNPDLKKLRELLEGFSTAVLATSRSDGGWHARPMAIARVEESANLWFITASDSTKAREIESDERVVVVCQDGWTGCVVLEGRAAVSRDRELIRELWRPTFRPWFPGGEDDPHLALIRVAGERAEYWDNSGTNRLLYVYQSIKAAALGLTPKIKEGEQHGTIIVANTG